MSDQHYGGVAAWEKKLSELTLSEFLIGLFWLGLCFVLVVFAVLGPVLTVMAILLLAGAIQGDIEIGGHIARTSGEYAFAMLSFISWAVVGISFFAIGQRRVLRNPVLRYRYLSAALGVLLVMLAYANSIHNRDLENMGAYALTVSAVDANTGDWVPANFDWPEGMGGTGIVRPQGSDAGASGAAKLWLANGETEVKVTCPGYEDEVLTVADGHNTVANMRTVKLKMRPLAPGQG